MVHYLPFSHNGTLWLNEKLTQWCLYPLPVGTSLHMRSSYFLFHSGIEPEQDVSMFHGIYWKSIRCHLLILTVPTAHFYAHCVLLFA